MTGAQAKRFDTLDGLRGVAALAVVLRHAGAIGSPGYMPYSYLAVDLFFMMSGFVIAHAYEAKIVSRMSFCEFMWKRIVRLYPLFFIGALLGVAAFIEQKYMGMAGEACLWQLSLILAFLCIPTPSRCGPDQSAFPFNGPAWSLSLEIVGNALYHLVARFLRTTVLFTIAALSGALIAVTVFKGVGPEALNVGYTLDTWWAGAQRFVFSFTVGLFIHRILPKLPRLSDLPFSQILPFALPVILAATLLHHFFTGIQAQLYILGLVLVGLPTIVILAVLVNPVGFLEPIYRALGLSSYALYIVHHPILRLIEQTSRARGFELAPYQPAISVLVLAMLVILALGLERFYDRPIRGWLSRLPKA